MTITESDRRCHANIINAPDPVAGIELVAAHREAGFAAGLNAAADHTDFVVRFPWTRKGKIAASIRALGEH